MKKRLLAILLFAILVISLIPDVNAFGVRSVTSETLGSITQCSVNKKFSTVTVSGSIKHSVLVDNSNARIAIYRFEPWKDVSTLIRTAIPLATAEISIRFQFELPCSTVSHRLSLYAVAIITNEGSVNMICEPCYPDLTAGSTSNVKFKGILSPDLSSAVAAHPGSAVVDVLLDKLDTGNKSGYIFNADGDLFYFDRNEINTIDKQIQTYSASGCNVFLRFLISPTAVGLAFCTNKTNYLANKCIQVNGAEALRAIYAYTYFLTSRYDGDGFGNIDGIIIGKGADTPTLYNYLDESVSDYAETYARSVSLIALSALEARGDSDLSFIVPVGDTLNQDGGVSAKAFLDKVASYIATHSNLSFTVMCESRHNPYKITDSMLDTENEQEGDITSEDITVETSPGDTSESTTSPVDDATFEVDSNVRDTSDASQTEAEAPDDVTDAPMQPPSPPSKPEINKYSDGYFCTDNIDVFLNTFNRLTKQYRSVNKTYIWCWYPSDDTLEGALGICFAYNYLKLSTLAADAFIVAFEGNTSKAFSGMSRLFKYIDTVNGADEAAYAKSVFEIEQWSDIIKGYNEGSGVYSTLVENELTVDTGGYIGKMKYLDYSSGGSAGDWFAGEFCNGINTYKDAVSSSLRIEFDHESAAFEFADVGYILDTADPLLLGDSLTFDIKCGEADSSLYELCIYIYAGNTTLVSRTVTEGGYRKNYCVDVSDFDSTDAVYSIRIGLKRITGSGACNLDLFGVNINSKTLNDHELEESFKDLKEYLNTDETDEYRPQTAVVLFCVITAAVLGVLLVTVSYGSDKRRIKEKNGNDNT